MQRCCSNRRQHCMSNKKMFAVIPVTFSILPSGSCCDIWTDLLGLQERPEQMWPGLQLTLRWGRVGPVSRAAGDGGEPAYPAGPAAGLQHPRAGGGDRWAHTVVRTQWRSGEYWAVSSPLSGPASPESALCSNNTNTHSHHYSQAKCMWCKCKILNWIFFSHFFPPLSKYSIHSIIRNFILWCSLHSARNINNGFRNYPAKFSLIYLSQKQVSRK